MANTYSATFDGVNQTLSRADNASLSITGNLTLQCWLNFTDLPTAGNNRGIMGKVDWSGTERSYYLFLQNNGGTYQLKFYSFDSGGTGAYSTVNWTPTAGVWYHVAAVYTAAANSVSFFVDGAQQGSTQTDARANLKDSTAAFVIGGTIGQAEYFKGQIDEPRVYNTARTGTNILADYDIQIVGNEAGLVSYWKLDNALTDENANANTLTNNNTVTFTTDTAQAFRAFSGSDTLGLADSQTTPWGWIISVADTLGITDTVKTAWGWVNQTKNSSSWTNQAKT